jgi:hypothetical protein
MLLGWDDASLEALVNADTVVHTSPHASMNAFEPMFAFPWAAAALAASSATPSRAVHLRTVVTHNNLGDLRWRPYAWWHRGRDGSVVKTTLFSRSRKLRHNVLLTQPIPDLDSSECVPMDRNATELARHACNYAYFCVVYRSFVERYAGLHGSTPTIEAPIDLLNAFSLHEDGLALWGAAVARFGMRLRTTDGAGRLVELARPPAADVGAQGRLLLCPNPINLLQAQLLGISHMIGAERMALYMPEAGELIARFAQHLGFLHRTPEFVGFTDVPIAAVLEHDPATISRFAVDGLRGSLPVGAADVGARVASNLDRLFDTGSSLTPVQATAVDQAALS